MSDEMLIAQERHEWMWCMNATGFLIMMDAIVFCVTCIFLIWSAYCVATYGSVLPAFQLHVAMSTFTGVTLVGFYYVYKYCIRKYSESEEF